jgi:hypothetical protein
VISTLFYIVDYVSAVDSSCTPGRRERGREKESVPTNASSFLVEPAHRVCKTTWAYSKK